MKKTTKLKSNTVPIPQIENVLIRKKSIFWVKLKKDKYLKGDNFSILFSDSKNKLFSTNSFCLVKLKNGFLKYKIPYSFPKDKYQIYFRIEMDRETVRKQHFFICSEFYRLQFPGTFNEPLYPLPIPREVLIEFINDRYCEDLKEKSESAFERFYNNRSRTDNDFHYLINLKNFKEAIKLYNF